MGDINAVGVWGIRGGTVSGGFLTAIWIIEILIVTLVAIMVSAGQAAKPYCEEENDWFQENDLNPVAHFVDVPALVKGLAAGDMEVLNAHLKPAGDIKSEDHAKITLYDAKSGENFVTIENQISETSDKGEVKFNSEDVTTFLKISQEVADRLKAVS